MNTKYVLKKLNLNKEGFEKIRVAVQNAESKTSGEIAVCLSSESSDYSFWEFFASIICSFVVFLALLPLSANLRLFYEKTNWLSPEWYLPLSFGLIFLLSILIFFFLFNIPALDRLIIPNAYKNKMVTKQSFFAFSKTGVYCTEHHNGILIYVSYLEKQVRVIADEGISKKISNDLWKIIADSLASDLKKGEGVNAFCEAIEKCGELLKEHFPRQEDSKNELSDGLLILEN